MARNDTFDRGAAAAAPAIIKKLHAQAKELLGASATVANLDSALKAAKSHLNNLRTVILPDLMMRCHQLEFTSNDGYKFTLKDFVAGSLPKDGEDDEEGDGEQAEKKEGESAREKAIAHINELGGGSLIKTELSIVFPKTEHNVALMIESRIKEMLEKEFRSEAQIKMRSGVHAQSLCAWAREKMAKGENIDLEVIGLHSGKAVAVKEPKTPEKKNEAAQKAAASKNAKDAKRGRSK
jgi:hypothetical protein